MKRNPLSQVKLVAQGLPTTVVSVWREDTGGFPSEPCQGQGGVPEGIMPSPWPQGMDTISAGNWYFQGGLHQTCLCSTAMDGNTARTTQGLHNFRILCFAT